MRRALEARERAAASQDEKIQAAYLTVASSWEYLARSARELEELQPLNQGGLYHRVRAWLRENSGQCCCEDCLAGRMAARHSSISAATTALNAEGGFNRYAGRCDSCGEWRSVTCAVPNIF